MRIGIDASCWSNARGYGRYTRELLRALVDSAPGEEFVCFLDPWTAERFDLAGANVEVVRVELSAAPSAAAAAEGSRSALDMLRLTRAVWRSGLDVFLSPSVYTYFPLPLRLPALVVVHDAIAERFPELTLPTLRDRLFWRAKVTVAVWQARLILTVSEFASRELTEVLGIAPEKMRVTNEAPAAAFRPSESPDQILAVAARFGLPRGARWVTYVGGFNPHKRVDALVRAHAAVARELAGEAPYLMLVGSVDGDVFHQGLAEIRSEIRRCGTEELVRWTGFVPDEELRHLHSGAAALLLPSANEGFGLPAVEAAACGTPVIATTASPLPSLLEGGGLFVEPTDEEGLIAALRLLVTDPAERATRGRRAREQAAKLSWERSAGVVLDAIREAAG